MSDHSRTDQALTLLAQPGCYEVLHALHARDGTATFAQIAAEARHALARLRALAAEGFVVSHSCGSLDTEPKAQTDFSLTAKGQAVAGHLIRLQSWAANRSARRHNHRWPG
jgi:DNA-binding HxlR family transcriptional regulator